MRLPEILAELEAERTQLDLAINALRLLGDRVTVPLTVVRREPKRRKPAKAVKVKRPPLRKKPRAETSSADLATKAVAMKRAGSKAREIARVLGITASKVYTLTQGVKRGQSETPKGGGPLRRCESCEQKGTADPCEHCGEPR